MFRADLAAHRIDCMRHQFWSTSPRRLINEPEALFTTQSYVGEIAAFRAVSKNQYEWLDHFSDHLDMRPLQEYCLKYYVLQKCITRPQLVRRNKEYFGKCGDEILRAIHHWRADHTSPATRSIFSFAAELAACFGDALITRLRLVGLPA